MSRELPSHKPGEMFLLMSPAAAANRLILSLQKVSVEYTAELFDCPGRYDVPAVVGLLALEQTVPP